MNSIYSFDKKEFISCEHLEKLPYDLVMCEFDGEKEIISENSYLFEAPNSHEEMLEEQKWRNDIKIGQELDFYLNCDVWVKAKVHGIKSDITPDVLRLVKRDFEGEMIPSDKMVGYFHKDNKKLALSCTHTDPLTEEEIREEEEKKEIKKFNASVSEKWKKEHKKYLTKNTQTPFSDQLEYYSSLSKCDTDFANEESLYQDADTETINYRRECPAFMALAMGIPKEQVAFGTVIAKIENSKHVFSKGDGYFDIKIFGATKATLIVDKNKGFELPMEKLKDGIFTFKDITYENPLFQSVMGTPLFKDIRVVNKDKHDCICEQHSDTCRLPEKYNREFEKGLRHNTPPEEMSESQLEKINYLKQKLEEYKALTDKYEKCKWLLWASDDSERHELFHVLTRGNKNMTMLLIHAKIFQQKTDHGHVLPRPYSNCICNFYKPMQETLCDNLEAYDSQSYGLME